MRASAEVLADVERGVPVGVVSARFHKGVALATSAALERLAGARGLDLVVLSGGVFQNRALLERTSALAERAGLRVLTPLALPAERWRNLVRAGGRGRRRRAAGWP